MSPDEGCSGDLGRRAPRQLSGEQGYPRASARRCRDQRSRALEAGASAFVAKTAPVQDVIVAIRHAAVAPSSFTASGLAEAVSRRRVSRPTNGSRMKLMMTAVHTVTRKGCP